LLAETPAGTTKPLQRYERIQSLIASDQCVLLDGATGSELIEVSGRRPELEEHLWGITAIIDAPDQVKALHRRYVDVGCDVITTNTWGVPTALREGGPRIWDPARPVHWMDVARTGVRLARDAAVEAGRGDDVAVAFSINGDVDTTDGRETIRLLSRAFEEEPPDLILIETMSLVRSSTYATVEALMATGLPVWMSFRRCRHGVCGIYGEHWGGPEGDAFGRAARRFEEIGIGALAINCVPPDHVPGMVSWLRDFTDLPLGVYPNLGYLTAGGWRNDRRVRGDEYAEMALSWREEGAQIIGGCCGVGPEQLAATRALLEGTRAGNSRPIVASETNSASGAGAAQQASLTDPRGRQLFPLDFPDLIVDEGVSAPTQSSFMIWKYLYREGIGAHRRCVDIGSGTGLLAVQLARNGAAHVHAIDVEEQAVSNTLNNAFRNGVAERVSADCVDVYPWEPKERYDVIVASLLQAPGDPFAPVVSHRPRDFWGRSLIDHLIGILPRALADDGVAYIMQLSILGERRTIELLERAGYSCRAVDYAMVGFEEGVEQEFNQVLRVEERSDAYHLRVGSRDVMVAYLLEVRREDHAGLTDGDLEFS
jgi:S-methylmethionine-dependent homocysteine/selenocysteine methylase/SAM-dependent methyltransferase